MFNFHENDAIHGEQQHRPITNRFAIELLHWLVDAHFWWKRCHTRWVAAPVSVVILIIKYSSTMREMDVIATPMIDWWKRSAWRWFGQSWWDQNNENEGKDRVTYATGVESSTEVRRMMIKTDLLQEIPSNYSLANGENKKDEVLAMCPAFGPGFAWITKYHPLENL